ncbi:MAG TPA: PEP-CTERM sorting domain-containing protein [Anaerolineae bacterium]|nr:PEP-CTERM sorting domain-containing protein [Anaerolineae bacterium]
MPNHGARQQNRWRTLGRVVAGLILLAFPTLARGAAQGPIVLDGRGEDWSSAWQVQVDALDVLITDTGTHPHDPETYARSGYDAIGLWAHYQAGDDRWYFRIDIDGRAGDSDSSTGTASNLGVGTHGTDQGPLVAMPFVDQQGLGNSEAYKLGFQFAEGGSGLTTELGPGEEILPGVLSPTSGTLTGQGIYSNTVPGVVEFAVDRLSLFPQGSARSQLWLSAQVGDNNDRVSDDQVAATWLMGLEMVVLCPAAPAVVGDEATFPLQYAIPAESALGPTGVVLRVTLPAGSTFVSASNGGQASGGIITWQLGDLAPGDSGQVTFTLRIQSTDITIDSEISSAEGLRFLASNTCPAVQPPATPANTRPAVPTGTPQPPSTAPSVVPEPGTMILTLAGLGGLAGYVGRQWRRQRRP